jgi:hypothetical protein
MCAAENNSEGCRDKHIDGDSTTMGNSATTTGFDGRAVTSSAACLPGYMEKQACSEGLAALPQ